MKDKFYLSDIEYFQCIAHFKDLRKMCLKDENGFYFKNSLFFHIINKCSIIIYYYYKELSLTFSTPDEVIHQYYNDYKEFFRSEIEKFNKVLKIKTQDEKFEDYGFTENRINGIRFFNNVGEYANEYFLYKQNNKIKENELN